MANQFEDERLLKGETQPDKGTKDNVPLIKEQGSRERSGL